MSGKTYTPTIGLEIHVQLKTQTKLFSRSKIDSSEVEPNVNVSPVDLAHPGTLPVLNKEAVKHVLKVGLALNGELADYTEWDRKNYFYPDIPKGYQISQYKYPLVKGGELAKVSITRVHLEEDTGRSSHEKGDFSLIDFNRAGVPLMELVTDPVIRSADQAGKFARELQLLLRSIGVSDANMEKGEMRVEANISISSSDQGFGTKVEIKNLNSFKAMERAIEYEISRHTAILESGEVVSQETRGWNEVTQETFSQRSKEDAHDYRYFPDPDIPKLYISEVPEFRREELLKEMPELPDDTRMRYKSLFQLREDSIETLLYNSSLRSLFESAAEALEGRSTGYQTLANYILSDVASLSLDSALDGHLSADSLADVVVFIEEGKLSSRGAKDLLALLYKNGGDAHATAQEQGLFQESGDGAIQEIVARVIAKNPSVADEVRAGKIEALQFLVGQGMKESQGRANPTLLKEMLEKMLHK